MEQWDEVALFGWLDIGEVLGRSGATSMTSKSTGMVECWGLDKVCQLCSIEPFCWGISVTSSV